MSNYFQDFFKFLENSNWHISLNKSKKSLPEHINKRYQNINKDYLDFLNYFSLCSTPNDMTWFISLDDFNGTSDSAFSWNEFETQSLDASGNDKIWREEIIQFWDNYLPIMMSVENGYSYYAIEIKTGKIVFGLEPEFEEPNVISDSFVQFLNMIENNKINL